LTFFSLLDNRPRYRNLNIGPPRSGISWSIDQFNSSMWSGLTQGKRRWALYPSTILPPGIDAEYDRFGNITDYKSPVAFSWFLDIYPYLPVQNRPIEFTQKSGEIVFIPTGWWYSYINLEECISVSQNLVNEQNIYLTVESLYVLSELELLKELTDKMKNIRPDIHNNILLTLDRLQGRRSYNRLQNILIKKDEEIKEKVDEIELLKRKLCEQMEINHILTQRQQDGNGDNNKLKTTQTLKNN